MWRLLTAWLFLLGSASGNEEFEKDGDVYVLTNKTFDDYVKATPTFLALFYAPRCHHCRKFAPVYVKVASKINVPSVKINSEVEKELANRYKIKSYPTLKFWHKGEGPMDLDCAYELEEIVEWVLTLTDPNYVPPPSPVVTLTSDNFTEYLAKQPLCLVKFYAPWCCKGWDRDYKRVARKLRDTSIKLAKVDVEANKKFARKYVYGFPSFVVMRYGRRSEYKGPDYTSGIIDHMKELAIPAVKKLTSADSINSFMEKQDITIVAFFASEDSTAFKAYSQAAEILREDFKSMGYTTDVKAFEKFDAKPNDMIIFYPAMFSSKFDPPSRKFNKPDATPEGITSFIRDHCTPFVGKRTMENVATRYNKLPLVVVYYNADFSLQYREGSEYWRQKVINIAQKYKDNYHFAIADEEEFEDELRKAGLGDSGLEHNVIVFGKDGKKYTMDPKEFDGDFEENFEEFMMKMSTGELEPNVTSAPVPRNNKAPVRILVAENFRKVVGDKSKDVFIEFYTPFKCGACAVFAPKYRELAIKLKKTQPNLILAKFDATANDVPPGFPTPSFPTFYFVPGGKKSSPIKYAGNREEEDLIKFMELHAVKSFRKEEKKEKKEKEEL